MSLLKSDAVYAILRRSILNAELAPGRSLRAAELGEMTGYGPTPIREALTRLQAEGFVDGTANRGFAVAPVTLAELEDLGASRALLETELILDSMAHADADYEGRVIAAHHKLSRTPPPRLDSSDETIDRWSEVHEGFHTALLSAARSPWQLRLWRITEEHLRRYHRWLLRSRAAISADPTAADQALFAEVLALAPHTWLKDAVLAGDAAMVRRLMAEHITLSTRTFLRLAGSTDSLPKVAAQ